MNESQAVCMQVTGRAQSTSVWTGVSRRLSVTSAPAMEHPREAWDEVGFGALEKRSAFVFPASMTKGLPGTRGKFRMFDAVFCRWLRHLEMSCFGRFKWRIWRCSWCLDSNGRSPSQFASLASASCYTQERANPRICKCKERGNATISLMDRFVLHAAYPTESMCGREGCTESARGRWLVGCLLHVSNRSTASSALYGLPWYLSVWKQRCDVVPVLPSCVAYQNLRSLSRTKAGSDPISFYVRNTHEIFGDLPNYTRKKVELTSSFDISYIDLCFFF